LCGEIGVRLRDLIRQISMTRDITILKGHVGSDHVHVLISAPPNMAVSHLAQAFKGKTSRCL
jgi:putative transposase